MSKFSQVLPLKPLGHVHFKVEILHVPPVKKLKIIQGNFLNNN
jgi:hypothetical protein